MKTQGVPAQTPLVTTEEQAGQIAMLMQRIAELEQENRWLREQLRLSMHKQYGASSEQSDTEQMNLFNEAEASADLSLPEPEISEVKAHHRGKTRLTTDKLPEDLPIEIIEHELHGEDCRCPECGKGLHVMGQETREELKIIPAKAVLVRHIRYTYACRNCEQHSDHVPMVKADFPEPVIKGGFAAPETIAHLVVQKFMMALPLYRQEQEWKQKGILLSRQTMANWLIKASNDWLAPVYEDMKTQLCRRDVLHGDETPLQVLKEPGKSAQSKSYMWLYRSGSDAEHPLILYEYQPDRSHRRPREFLEHFSGYLHSDGYEGYHTLPEGIVVVGCLAHLRRKFFDSLKTLPKDKQKGSNAAKGVAYCDQLFLLERSFATLSPEDRFRERGRQSKPLLLEFYAWIDRMGALPKSMIGQAVGYAKSQRLYLERYLLDGRLEISNNRAERSIKPFVIGRKNWLFCNTPGGAKSSAIYYSLIQTALENGLNPFEYLTWLLRQVPNMGRPGYVENVAQLLPGSPVIPKEVFAPVPKKQEPEIYPWEEEQ